MNADDIKKFCKDNGLTYKELAELIGYGEGAVKNAVSTNNISFQMQHAIKMYSQILELKSKLQKTQNFKQNLKDFLAD